MQTTFSLQQLADPNIAEADGILRACVHCGFCTATCPTFLLRSDELDSPRGRIYLIKDMLEKDRPAPPVLVHHVDRCLSCLSCMTTCPSGVHYMHLVDIARERIEQTYRRPADDRWLRAFLAWMLPHPMRFRLGLFVAMMIRPFAGRVQAALPSGRFAERIGAMLTMTPRSLPAPSPVDRPQTFPAQGNKRARVALMTGCAQRILNPAINEASIRLLTHHGCEVVIVKGMGCCGALTHHMGRTHDSHIEAAANIRAWIKEADQAGLDAVIINTSGCGTTIKDYGFMFRNNPELAEPAQRISALAYDITEFISKLGLDPTAQAPEALSVTYHSACSMQHGQNIHEQPTNLLRQAGFTVRTIPESHICCGSAGTYNLLQPRLADALRIRKLAQIRSTDPDVIASGNIGCMIQIGNGAGVPVLHTAELLDWATGGPRPAAL